MFKHSSEEPKSDKPQTQAPDAEPQPSQQTKEKELQEQLLRLKADFENTKKRLERDKLEAIKYANERLVLEILPIVDNLDRALGSLAEGHDPEKVQQGLKIAQEELHKVLEQHGVQMIKSLGAMFDPRFHEAVATIPDQDKKDGMVVDEIQRGYLLNGRLVRPSRVRVVQHEATA